LHCAGAAVDEECLWSTLDVALAHYSFHARHLDSESSDLRVLAIYRHCVSLLILARYVLDRDLKRAPRLQDEAAQMLWGQPSADRLVGSIFWRDRFDTMHSAGVATIALVRSSSTSQRGIYSESEESIGTLKVFDNDHARLERWWETPQEFIAFWGGQRERKTRA
jgi:hypothetical protein